MAEIEEENERLKKENAELKHKLELTIEIMAECNIFKKQDSDMPKMWII